MTAAHLPRPTTRQVEREARRVFRFLYHTEGWIGAMPGEQGTFGVFQKKGQRPVLKVEEWLVDAFRRADWLRRPLAGRLMLSDTGAAWYRRQQAPENPYQAQHMASGNRQIAGAGGKVKTVRVNEAESPLGWLRRRKGRDGRPLLDALQFAAGERLRLDYTMARLMPGVTSNWSEALSSGSKRRSGLPGGNADCTDRAVAARQRVTRALEATGPELARVLVDVCCHLKGLEEAEKSHGWPQRSGKLVLQIALTALARHYRLLPGSSAAQEHPGHIIHWGEDDYRPSLE